MTICPETHDIYTGSRDCRIKRWSSRRNDRSGSSRNNGSTPAPSPASATNGSTSTLRCIGDLAGHTGWVSALAATPEVLISASYDASVRLWSERDCRLLANLTDVHDDYVTRLAVAPHVGKFVSAGLRGHLHWWDLEALQRVATASAAGNDEVPEDMHHRARRPPQGGCVNSGSIYALHCTPDGRLCAFNGPEGCDPAPLLPPSSPPLPSPPFLHRQPAMALIDRGGNTAEPCMPGSASCAFSGYLRPRCSVLSVHASSPAPLCY